MTDVMLPLDDPFWSDLGHAYGSGTDIPDWIRDLEESGFGDEFPISAICHQLTTYDGTYAAIPHLVRVCAADSPESLSRIRILNFVGWCVACLRLNRTVAPNTLVSWFKASVPRARDLIAESLPFVTDSPGSQANLQGLLAAFASCHGEPDLGFVLYDLEGGGNICPNCDAFIKPMESFNPFWVEKHIDSAVKRIQTEIVATECDRFTPATISPDVLKFLKDLADCNSESCSEFSSQLLALPGCAITNELLKRIVPAHVQPRINEYREREQELTDRERKAVFQGNVDEVRKWRIEKNKLMQSLSQETHNIEFLVSAETVRFVLESLGLRLP